MCDEATSVGSPWYSGRHIIEHPDGERTFLCPLCDERVRSARGGRRLTDDEMRDPDAFGLLAVIGTLRTDARR